jgi:hypothetical protein
MQTLPSRERFHFGGDVLSGKGAVRRWLAANVRRNSVVSARYRHRATAKVKKISRERVSRKFFHADITKKCKKLNLYIDSKHI